ncbi:MAG: DUF2851 family protein [Cyclobacteriaceae bacterium]|nr:DUF2851 family protein [Cyclobacteriaceae bacterium]
MDESFLHFVWQHQYYNKSDLTTADGHKVEVYQPGHYNTNAGPDFLNARIKIGDLIWNGSIEIHVMSEDWFNHKHHLNMVYDSVVLHVVWQGDRRAQRTDNTDIPTVFLKTRVPQSIFKKYQNLLGSIDHLPCSQFISNIPEVILQNMLDHVLIQRLERKASEIISLYESNAGDWEETAYQILLKSFGFQKNSELFHKLGRALPLKILKRHRDKIVQVESLLFGMAGFLKGKPGDDYHENLQKEFAFLCQKYGLEDRIIEPHLWKFMRMRPANFPTLRLAQLAVLIVQSDNIFSSLVYAGSVRSILNYLCINPGNYWREHYYFGKKTQKHSADLGEAGMEGIIINAVVPLMAAYGMHTDDHSWIEGAIQLLEQIRPENNSIVQRVSSSGIQVGKACDSQAAIELYKNYCTKRKCLHCKIGTYILKPEDK